MAKHPRTLKRYVGPAYNKGIRLPGYDHDIRPAGFTPVEVDAFVRRHPEYADWWQEPQEAKPDQPPEEKD